MAQDGRSFKRQSIQITDLTTASSSNLDQIANMVLTSGPETLDLPRILCLHGAGTTAEILSLQMRAVMPAISNYFRLVFVDGPCENDMHPDMYPVFSGMGPYRSWTRWRPNHEILPVDETIKQIESSLVDAMEADEGYGDWVGILGFSQGAKVAFSVLYENQLRLRQNPNAEPFAGVDWKFGLIFAGYGAPYALSDLTMDDPRFVTPGEVAESQKHIPMDTPDPRGPLEKLTTPTLHVHGLLDPSLDYFRVMHHNWCAPSSDVLVEWEGPHRIPVKKPDVKNVVAGIIKIGKQAGEI